MSDAILDTLETLRKSADGDSVKLGRILDDIKQRGYGPLIMLLSVFVILPTGMIPGVPAVVGFALLLIAGQMLVGRKQPWFPQKLQNFSLDTDKIRKSVDVARPWAKRLSKVLRPRLTALTEGTVAGQCVAACITLAAFLMIPLGFVPLLPLALGAACLLLGLGMATRDGVVILIGYVIFILGLTLIVGQV